MKGGGKKMSRKTQNKRFNFEWEFKNYAIRTCHQIWGDKNSPIRKNCPVELIRFNDESHSSCYTIAFWCRDEEGYELRFVGSRPFVDITADEMSSIWNQLRAAQKMLDEYFEADEEEYE